MSYDDISYLELISWNEFYHDIEMLTAFISTSKYLGILEVTSLYFSLCLSVSRPLIANHSSQFTFACAFICVCVCIVL